MKLPVVFLMLVHFGSAAKNYSLSNSDAIQFHPKAVSCDRNPKYTYDIECTLKPTRDRKGKFTFKFGINGPLSDIWVHFKVFYKYNTIYREYMVNVDGGLCCTIDNSCDSGLMITVLLKSIKHIAPSVIHNCPYNGMTGMEDVDLNSIVSAMIPQVIPSGDYKILLRFHTKANESIYNLELKAYIKASDIMKTMQMG